MFGFLRQDPRKKLRKAYDAKLEEAMTAQRNGDIRSYSMLSQEADALWRELEAMDKAE